MNIIESAKRLYSELNAKQDQRELEEQRPIGNQIEMSPILFRNKYCLSL